MLKVKKVGETTVSLDYATCPEDGGKYELICNNHGYLIQDDNKSRLWRHSVEPRSWCAACDGQDPRYNKVQVSA